jgi:Txe/YoeB family toxin of Txe-Axe toxin-antitoxin module
MEKTKFQTVVDIPESGWRTGYFKKNLFMGSCFTENIGNKMAALKYNVNINPFGILYNPSSVAGGLRILLENRTFQENDLIKYGGLWHSFFHHGKFSGIHSADVLQKINTEITNSASFLKEADFLFITFGTAWVYLHKKGGQQVSNCHKIPAGEFDRIRLSVEKIVSDYTGLFSEIRKINPEVKVIFTISPIRHWKDGAIENQRSKATLSLAIDQIIRELGKDWCFYFPAYEIVMDELRDYRFYAEDMIHLSGVAVNHIWEIFQDAFIEKESRKIATRIEKIVKAAEHKPFNKTTGEYLKFLHSTLKQMNELETQFPNINFGLEKEHFIAEINEFKRNDEHF